MDILLSLPCSKTYSIPTTLPHMHFGFKLFSVTFSLLYFLSDNCFNQFSVPVRFRSSFSEHTILMPASTCCAFSTFVSLFILFSSSTPPLPTPILILPALWQGPFKVSHLQKPFKLFRPMLIVSFSMLLLL